MGGAWKISEKPAKGVEAISVRFVSPLPTMLRLEKGFGQGGPISGYLFSFTLEKGFSFLRNNNKIKSINILNHLFSYSIYAFIIQLYSFF